MTVCAFGPSGAHLCGLDFTRPAWCCQRELDDVDDDDRATRERLMGVAGA